jgi:hypothetical protein
MPPIPILENATKYYPPIYAYAFQAVSFPQFPHKNPVCSPSLPPIHATFRAHLILLDFITQIVFGGEYKARRSSLYSLFHYPVNSSLIDPNNIILHILIFVFLDCNLEDKKILQRMIVSIPLVRSVLNFFMNVVSIC